MEITAVNFARTTPEGFGFGIKAPHTSAELRKLADAIDAGEILVQRVEVMSAASLEGFATTRFLLELVQKRL